MQTMSTKLNFKETHFPHPTLTPIKGYPSYAQLIQLRREVNANLGSIPTKLGGGKHGHIGLGFTATSYARSCPGTPYERPSDPGPFTPDPTVPFKLLSF